MELLDRFLPASRQLAKCGLARFGPDLSQSGSKRTEARPGDRSDESPGESQWQKKKGYTTTSSFLTIHAFAVKTKSELIFFASFLIMIAACPSFFLWRPLLRTDSQSLLPSFHASAPTDRPGAVTMFVVECYKFRGEPAWTKQWWPSDDKEQLILMDRSSSGWDRIGGGGGINESKADKPTTNQEHRPDAGDF